MISAKAEKHIIKVLETISKVQFKYFNKESEIDHNSLMNYLEVQ